MSNFFGDTSTETKKPALNPDVAAQRKKEYEGIKNFNAALQMRIEGAMQNPIMSGFRKVSGSTITKDVPSVVNHQDIAKAAYACRAQFEDALKRSLFCNTLNIICLESCPLDEKVVSNSNVRRASYGMIRAMFEDCEDNLKSFTNACEKNEVPTFIQEIWECACECARVETDWRFNPDRIMSFCGNDGNRLQEVLQNECANVNLQNSVLANQYNSLATILTIENEDVIAEIKNKVNSDINQYKENAQKINDAKASVKENLDSANKVEDGKPSADTSDPNAGGTNDNPDSNGNGSGDTNSTSPDANSSGDEGAAAANTDTMPGQTDNNGEGNADGGDTTSAQNDLDKLKNQAGAAAGGEGREQQTQTTDGGQTDSSQQPANGANTQPPLMAPDTGGSGTTNEGDDLGGDASSQAVNTVQVDPETERAVEDATTFAMKNKHTFNTGDEKFSELRKKYAAEMTRAMSANNMEELQKVRDKISFTYDRFKQVNNASNNKYSSTLQKFGEINNSIKFEIGRRVSEQVQVAQESHNVLEALVLKIAKRKMAANALKMESGDDPLSMQDKYTAVQEAVMNDTILETFNTLKIIPSNKADGMRAFIKGLRA